MKKFFTLTLCLLLLACLFSGCGDEKKTTDSSTADTASDIFSTADVKFLSESNESVYIIIRPESSKENTAVANYLYKKMKDALGVNIKNLDDSTDGNDQYEILLGETNRQETALVKDYFINEIGGRVSDYIIATVGKKIVIYALSTESLQAASEYFIKSILTKDGVKGGIKHTQVTAGSFVNSAINGQRLSRFQIVKQRFNESYMVQNSIEEAIVTLTETTGYKLDIVEDHNAASEYEIIVGNANRDGVTKVTNADEYSVKISGKKVYLNGGCPQAIAMAVSEFAKLAANGTVTDADSKTGSYSQTFSTYDASKTYTRTWGDDFNYVSAGKNGVDSSAWNILEPGDKDAEGQNGRTSVRTSDILKVDENGIFNAYAGYDDNYYYGFMLHTKGKMHYLYGILEMSAKLPHGESFWISLWANSYHIGHQAAYLTEVNVVEMFGNSKTEASNMHGWLKSSAYAKQYYEDVWKPKGYADHWSLDAGYSNEKKYTCPEGNLGDAFHTYSYIWTPNGAKFACDGNVYFELDFNKEEIYKETFTQRLYVTLSEAVCFASNGNMPDDSPAWEQSNNFQVDYVHIYQKADGLHELEINPAMG